MYPSPGEKIAISEAEKLMVETMARYDPSHDKYHVERVRKTAMTIARSLPTPPDLFVVEMAALLHDVLDKKYVPAEHYNAPDAFFQPFFQSIHKKSGLNLIEDGRANLIVKVMTNVSWSTESKLIKEGILEPWHKECVELHCVQDADRLDAIGAFGVLRCAAYTAARNEPLHTSSDDPLLPQSAIQHFYDKLVHIHERMKTETGKTMAQKRNQLVLDFLDAIASEHAVV